MSTTDLDKVAVTKSHVIAAARRAANDTLPEGHVFRMSQWGDITECGTVGCLWGTAHLIATGTLTDREPPSDWVAQSPWHKAVNKLFFMSGLGSREVLTILESIGSDGVMNLRGANLSNVDLAGARLDGAELAGANLSDADLRGASLRGANLEGAELFYADLQGADLRGAGLSGANLSNANLFDASLEGANLSGAALSGAILKNANLRGAIFDNDDE